MITELKMLIVGGPLDGATGKWKGEFEKPNWENLLDKVEIEGHRYKVVEFDKESKCVTLMW